MEEKTVVTLIKDDAGNVRRVRIGDQEFPVMHAGPVSGPGQSNLVMTVSNVDLKYEFMPDKEQT